MWRRWAAALLVAGTVAGSAIVVMTPFSDGGGVSCDRNATSTATLATQLTAATAGQTICLASATYTFPTSSVTKSSPGVTIREQSGATATLNDMSLRVGQSAAWITFDGLTMDDMEICEPTNHITVKNSLFDASAVTIRQGGGAGTCGASGSLINAAILFDNDVFQNFVPTGGLEGRVHLPGPDAPGPSGVTIQNSLFTGGTGDGVASGANGVQILNNEFANLIDCGCGPHTDAIQIWGATNNVVRGNYLHNDTTGIMNYDGDNNGNVVSHNILTGVTGDGGFAVIQLGGGTNEQVIHNTIVGSGKAINFGSKSGQQATGVIVRDNITPGGVVSSGAGAAASYAQNNYNLCGVSAADCAGANSITSSSATFVGGATPVTIAGHALTGGSLGKGNASDATDRGADVTQVGRG